MAAYTTIDDPSAHFKVQLYTGTGSALAVTFDDTDTDMSPDFVYVKGRSAVTSSLLFDSVRGTGKYLNGSSAGAEVSEAQSITAFGSDGFSMGTESDMNTSTDLYVSWNWKAGTTSGINTTGSTITPSAYSFNQDVGFSIIKYEGNATGGALLPHALAVVPEFAIFKSIDDTPNWRVYHKGTDATAPEDYGLILNNNSVRDNDNTAFNDTAPTSVLMCLGTSPTTNDGSTMMAYFFAGKQGFSKFGSYTGTNNVNGPFIWLGFRPAFLIIKKTDATGEGWQINDNERDPHNPATVTLWADATDADTTNAAYAVDFLSNGFKIRTSDGGKNNVNNYIYAAFAEASFVNSNGVPCNAR